MTQYLIIGALVAWAAVYSVWALMPAASRRAVAMRVARWARRRGLAEPASLALQEKLGKAGACGECDKCGGCGKNRAG